MIGKILGGRYEIIEQIGGGGMALVYKAKCKLLDRFVAIKVLKDEFVNDEEFVRKFRRESQAAASLSHPNIVNIYDVGVEDEGSNQIYYIVMEYIKGKTLKDVIKENGKLSMENTIDYSYQIAEALQQAHKNQIVHRDIKPHNIMITEDNRVKVTDFGIARAATSSTVTTTSNVLGSVHYFSPEQARGGYTDEKSDIYSLGIVMYEMLTGKLPYQGESPITVALKHVQEDIVPPRKLDNTIPVGLENIILKCVQKRQADRYSNITELIRDLRKIKETSDFSTDEMDSYESHTKVIPVVDIEGDEKMVKKKQKKKKDSTGKVIFLGILLAFLLATSAFLGYFKLKDFFVSSEPVIVPDLYNMSEIDAKKEVEELGLEFRVLARVKNSDVQPGHVFQQSEDAGTKVKKGYPIEVSVSEGDDLVKVPSLENKALSDVKEMLDAAGLNIKVEYEHSETIPEDVVIKQSPESGTMVESGTRVNLIVSQGTEIKLVPMPKLTTLNIEAAKAKIKELDLEVGDIKYEPNNEVEKDIVVWQSYNQGIEIETKTAVDLLVSSGPMEEAESGNNESGGNADNDNEGNTSGEEGPITFNVTPLQEKEETKIKIIRIQDGVSKVVYNKKHKVSEGEVSITLEGKQGAQFEIYYDDIYQTTLPKN